jgi:isocitrate lyase
MPAYVDLQDRESATEEDGYSAIRHQAEVGTGYYDAITSVIAGEELETLSLRGSTEVEQFEAPRDA